MNNIMLSDGRDGALRRPPARAFLSPAGRVVKIPLAENWEAPAGTSRRNVPTYSYPNALTNGSSLAKCGSRYF